MEVKFVQGHLHLNVNILEGKDVRAGGMNGQLELSEEGFLECKSSAA